MTHEDLLPELPPLADDGALADVDDGFLPDESEALTDDRGSHDLALGNLIDSLDEQSAMDDRVADIEQASVEANEPESGWLDDRTMEIDLGVAFDTEDRAAANDSGQDGIDEAPRQVKEGADDDASGLPSMTPGSEGDGIDEAVIVPTITDD